jgi:phosphoglycolate phosphatase
MIKLVILDFDDTLCMTEEATFHMENEMAADMGFPPMLRKVHQRTWGTLLREATPIRFPGIDVDEFLNRLEEYMRKYIASGKLDSIPKENLKILDMLIDSGKVLAILTSRMHLEITHLLDENHPLSSKIAEFYCKDNTDYIKPDPKIFDKVLNKFGVKPYEAVYVGDSPGDAKCAKEAGLYFIASLESGIRSLTDFNGLGVDRYIKIFSELNKAVNSLEI